MAKDRYVAEDALELIEVDYESLDPVLDPALGEVVSERAFSYGDPDEAFERADLVIEETFAFPRWTCAPVECYGVVADWDAAAGSLTAWANFQGPFTLHSVAAAALGLPGSKLRIITPRDSGGSFGIKSTIYVYIALMGLASRKLGVPVRWIEDRLEHLAGSSGSTARTTAVRAGFSGEGELLAVAYDVVEDVGAYVRAPEPATLYRMHGSLSGAYRVRNVASRNRVVLTNRCPTGLNRGFGGPQLYLALEGAMNLAAARLGLDPAELRRRNLSRPASFPTARRRAGSTTPATTRPVSTTRSSSRATTSGAPSRPRPGRRAGWWGSASPAWSSPRSRTWATSRSSRRRRSAPRHCPSRGTRRARP